MRFNMNEEAQIFLSIAAVAVAAVLILGSLFWMLGANAHNHSVHQRAHDKACQTISDESLRRDCLSGVSLVEHPEYAK